MSRRHSVNLRMPICSLQIACDGVAVKGENAVCYKCRDKQAKKAKTPPPLRGATLCVTKKELKELEQEDRLLIDNPDLVREVARAHYARRKSTP